MCYLKHIVEIYEDTGDKRHYMLPLSRKTKEIKNKPTPHNLWPLKLGRQVGRLA